MYFRNLIFLNILLVIICFSFPSNAQIVSGLILNEKNEPVPYATIFVQEAKKGTITNSNGNFNLQLENGIYHLIIRSLGYLQIERTIELKTDSLDLDILMQQQNFEIKEIKIFPGKEDPAYYIMRKAITKASYFLSLIHISEPTRRTPISY